MSSVIIQARDWSDWYVIRDWLNANAPGEWHHRSVQDNSPAAFEYPQRYQSGLMAALYPDSLPVAPIAPSPVASPPAAPAPVAPPPVAPSPSLTPMPSSAPSVPDADAGVRSGISRHTAPPVVGETTEVIVTSAGDQGDAEPVTGDAASARSDRRKGGTGRGTRS